MVEGDSISSAAVSEGGADDGVPEEGTGCMVVGGSFEYELRVGEETEAGVGGDEAGGQEGRELAGREEELGVDLLDLEKTGALLEEGVEGGGHRIRRQSGGGGGEEAASTRKHVGFPPELFRSKFLNILSNFYMFNKVIIIFKTNNFNIFL